MVKGKVYSVIGVDGIQLSRTRGMSILYNGVSADNSAIDDEVFDEITADYNNFIDNGFDAIVEFDYNTDGSLTATDIISLGDESEFDNMFEVDPDYADEDDNYNQD